MLQTYLHLSLNYYGADLARERKRQLTTARANQTTGVINGRAVNWAPEVAFSPFRALSRPQLTFRFRCQIMIHATLPRNCVKHANVRKRKAECKQSSYMYESSVFFSLFRMARVSLKHFIGIDPTWKQYSEWWIKITQVWYMTCTVLCSLVNEEA